MAISNIGVSLVLSESTLSEYAIKHNTIIFKKRLILAWWVTHTHIYIYIYIYIYVHTTHPHLLSYNVYILAWFRRIMDSTTNPLDLTSCGLSCFLIRYKGPKAGHDYNNH